MNPNQPQGAAPRDDSFDVITVYNPSPDPFPVYYNSALQAVIQPGKAIQLVKLVAGDENRGAVKHLIDRMCRLNNKPKNEPAVRSAWIEKIVLRESVNHAPVLTTLEAQALAVNQDLAKQPLDVPAPSIPEPVAPTPSLAQEPTLPTPPAPSNNWKFDPMTGKPLATKPVITPESVDVSHVEIQSAQATLPPAAASVVNPIPVVAPLPVTGDPVADAALNDFRGNGKDGEARVIGEEIPAVDAPPPPLVPTRPENPTREDLVAYARDVVMMDINEETTRQMLADMPVDQLKNELKYDMYA